MVMNKNSKIFEKYTLDPPAIKQSIRHLLDMAGFRDEEKLTVVVMEGQITILRKEKG